jgi:hypothetical protein
MMRNYSAGETCKDVPPDVPPKIASLRAILRLDGNRFCGPLHEEGRLRAILGPQRFQLPAGSVNNAQPVAVIDENAKIGLGVIACGAGRFEHAFRVLPYSAHTLHIGRKSKLNATGILISPG